MINCQLEVSPPGRVKHPLSLTKKKQKTSECDFSVQSRDFTDWGYSKLSYFNVDSWFKTQSFVVLAYILNFGVRLVQRDEIFLQRPIQVIQ